MILNRDPLQNKRGSVELNYLPVAAAEGRAYQTGSVYCRSGAGGMEDLQEVVLTFSFISINCWGFLFKLPEGVESCSLEINAHMDLAHQSF